MKKYVLVAQLMISFFSMQTIIFGMEVKDDIQQHNPQEEGQGASMHEDGATRDIRIISYFADNTEYLSILRELLKDYQWNGASKKSVDLQPIERLIRDMRTGKRVKTNPQQYGAIKRLLPNSSIVPLSYEPSKTYSFPSLREICIHRVLQVTCNNPKKYAYDNRALAKIFKDFPFPELERILKYPGIPKATKLAILDAAQKKQGVHDAQLKKRFEGLDGMIAFKNKNIKKVLRIIACLPQIDTNQKENIFSFVSDVRSRTVTDEPHLRKLLDQGANPVKFLDEAITHLSYHGDLVKYPFYTEVIDYAFEHYPLCTAATLARLATQNKSVKKSNIAFAIVKAHKLLQQAVENDPVIVERALCDIRLLKLLLDYGVNFSHLPDQKVKYPMLNDKFATSFEHTAVSTGNIDVLLLLRDYGVEFKNPTLIDTALQTNCRSCLSFILDQQRDSLTHDPAFYFDFLTKQTRGFVSLVSRKLGKEIHAGYVTKVYKALLQARHTGDVRPLETLIFDSVQMQEWYKVRHKVRKAWIFFDAQVIKRSVDEAKDRLSSNESLGALLYRYPILLDPLIRKISKVNNADYNNMLNMGLQPRQTACWPACGALVTGYLLWRSWNVLDDNPLLRVSVLTGLSGALAWSGWKTYGYFAKYFQQQQMFADKLRRQKYRTYLEGYLRGLKGENGRKVSPAQEQKYKKRASSHASKILANLIGPLAVGCLAIPCAELGIGLNYDIKYLYNDKGEIIRHILAEESLCKSSPRLFKFGLYGSLGCGITRIFAKSTKRQYAVALDSKCEFLDYCLEHGKRDGFAKVTAFNEQESKEEDVLQG